MHQRVTEISQTFDVAVLGAGAGGLAAAIFAALEGARVLLVERCSHVGGTSAYSAGSTWIPLTRHAEAMEADDSYEKVAGFLDRAVGNQSAAAMRAAFLAAGRDVVETLEAPDGALRYMHGAAGLGPAMDLSKPSWSA